MSKRKSKRVATDKGESGRASVNGSAAVVAEIRCEGRTIEELADRIALVAGRVRNCSGKYWEAGKHSRCEVKPINQPPNVPDQ